MLKPRKVYRSRSVSPQGSGEAAEGVNRVLPSLVSIRFTPGTGVGGSKNVKPMWIYLEA